MRPLLCCLLLATALGCDPDEIDADASTAAADAAAPQGDGGPAGPDAAAAPGSDAAGVPGADAAGAGPDAGSAKPDAATAGRDAAAAPGPDGGTQDPLADAWLQEHNRVRASAQPTPSPALPPLTWNAAAAGVAKAWAENCSWKHNANRGSYGENIYASTGQPTPASVVSSWASEAPNYDYATNTCASGKVCGHYTQIVWRATTSVGCFINRCASGSPFGGGAWYFGVCDYSPPGNYTGQKPY